RPAHPREIGAVARRRLSSQALHEGDLGRVTVLVERVNIWTQLLRHAAIVPLTLRSPRRPLLGGRDVRPRSDRGRPAPSRTATRHAHPRSYAGNRTQCSERTPATRSAP